MQGSSDVRGDQVQDLAREQGACGERGDAAEDLGDKASPPRGLTFSATYDPCDNKLRLSASERLPKDLYERVRAAGFIWAPRQEIFVAPMWTPERADLAVELAGEIGDEDTSLVERAEERSERFEEYKEKRSSDAEAAHAAVERITDGIPMGQPILVGHHSEAHARRDAKRIENGMRRAVSMWETAAYWERRAKGAVRHAKYKEQPAVRHRRIKGLEADLRKQARTIDDAEKFLEAWRAISAETDPARARERAMKVANYDHSSLWYSLDREEISGLDAAQKAIEMHSRTTVRAQRWVDHLTNRIGYERAMLGEQGGLPADRFQIEVGGQVQRRGKWFVVLGVNRQEERITSLKVAGHFMSTIGVEEVSDYRAPKEGDAEKVRAATKLAPLLNIRTPGCVEMTQAEYKRAASYGAACTRVAPKSEEHGAYRYRTIYRGGKQADVFITDAKEHASKPALVEKPAPLPERELPEVKPRKPLPESGETLSQKAAAARVALKQGVTSVVAKNLFPTPRPIVDRMVLLADVRSGHRVCEPSAGTGAIVSALREIEGAIVIPVEIDPRLAKITGAVCADWVGLDIGPFDRIVMNPPFDHGIEVRHIEWARAQLRPGGRLVALCADSPRAREKLKPHALTWEKLGQAFKEQGTGVNVVMLSMGALGDDEEEDEDG